MQLISLQPKQKPETLPLQNDKEDEVPSGIPWYRDGSSIVKLVAAVGTVITAMAALRC
jgi:hypothetical protein